MKMAIMAAAAVMAFSATALQAQGNSEQRREQAPSAAPASPGRSGGGDAGRGGGMRPDAGGMRAQPQQQAPRSDRGDRGGMREQPQQRAPRMGSGGVRDPGAVAPRTYREGRTQRYEMRRGDRTRYGRQWRAPAAAGFIFLGGPRIIVRGYGPGWCRGLHRGYHWAPRIGWHRSTHRGLYRCG
jgi:hypothetical protein